MAVAATVGSLGAFLPRRCLRNPRCLSVKPPLSARIRASSSATASVEADPVALIPDAKVSTGINNLGCPVCYYPLISQSNASQTIESTAGSYVECHICKKAYFSNGTYLDLTVAGGSKEYTETMPGGTELFRSQLVSFLYERGWRQNFIWGGFPGPQREFEMAKVYLTPTIGGTIVDASCGSGLFSRLFAESGMYSLVVALDFSENMLLQCDEFIKQKGISKENLILVRADISRLPFVSSSIDAVHAGAALHCWPSPSTAVAEISRVLRPGGVFVATTFVLDTIPPAVPIFRAIREFFSRNSGQHLYLSEGELEDICRACGLIGFTCIRNGFFIMISATKPSKSSS
ncbi:uncharacterized methyltransferase At1g78140, chloroplastic [Elaeis guineensis]|uniref:Uncharacterized methyltransferase At1g78140, chloroplastic n=1 Tax=Elaeis guineensis var. tenera TaxID=51953 RepID=A0A6I9S5H5_ELAGV|nr:uncharacterized methyltransferase At1g78140, chloroplastic [Elaeis guineensis]